MSDDLDIAGQKLWRILGDSMRIARRRMHEELSPGELAALLSGPAPKAPTNEVFALLCADGLADNVAGTVDGSYAGADAARSLARRLGN